MPTRLPRLLRILVLGAFLAFPGLLHAEPLRMVSGENGVARYAKGLLKIVFSKVPNNYEWDETAETSTEARIVEQLKSNKLDIVWYSTSNEFEEQMLPIRIPIYRGLLGYRIFMIKEGTQSKFNGIKNLSDLNRVSIAQGRFWADTQILEANGVDVLKVTQYNSLFYMLDGDRFDAFPRGVHEPWDEIPRWPDLALGVEQNLMLSYTCPFYFFVNKNNNKLAKEIETGLRIAIADGSFENYFLNDPTVKAVLAKANVKERHLIKLSNPLLPTTTPVDDESLWFNPYAL